MSPERWRQIEETFQAAADLVTEQRSAFLDEICAHDQDLRREVESLLATDLDQEGSFATLITSVADSLSAEQRDQFVGRRIGPYRVTGLIGQGGMAEVLRAVRDDDQYDKQVAIKLVRPGLVTEFMLDRFRSERQILATLEHQHIARFLDGGTTEDGLPYLVMEYIEGQPITQYAQSHHLTIRQRLILFRSVCAAVQYAHRNLVVHRDLKPTNIFVTNNGIPKLLDFGIAKLLDPGLDPESQARTETGMLLMTPDYASPEQVRGEPVTTATDIYSLGAVLYELLTGQKPHQFENHSIAEIERVICRDEPRKPSDVVRWDRTSGLQSNTEQEDKEHPVAEVEAPARQTHRRELAGDLDHIVLMALRKESERRYQSVDQFSEDIRRHLAGLPILARKNTLGYRTGKFVKRNKTGVIFTAILLVILFVATIAMVSQAAEIASERDRANHVTNFLVELFALSDPSGKQGNTITAREILDAGAARVRREFASQPELQAVLMERIGQGYKSLGLYDNAEPLLQDALDIRRHMLGEEDPAVAENLQQLAVLMHIKGDFTSAEQLYQEAVTLRQKNLGSEHPDVAVSLNGLGLLNYHMGDLDHAESVYRQALAIRRKRLGPDHPDVAESLSGLALVLERKGQYDEAEDLNRQALMLRRKWLSDQDPAVATSLSSLASVLTAKGNTVEAETLYREALAIRRKSLPSGHPHIAYSLVGLGELLVTRGDPQQAEPLLREAVDIRMKSLTENHWLTAEAMSALGECLTELRRFDEAEKWLSKSLAVVEAHQGGSDEHRQETLSHLIKLNEARGLPEQAEKYRVVLSEGSNGQGH